MMSWPNNYFFFLLQATWYSTSCSLYWITQYFTLNLGRCLDFCLTWGGDLHSSERKYVPNLTQLFYLITLIHPVRAKTTELVRKCCWVFLSRISQNIGNCKEKWGISLVAQMVKHVPTMWGTWVFSLVGKHPLEKEMATHSSILACCCCCCC